jgi:hypothetical protein
MPHFFDICGIISIELRRRKKWNFENDYVMRVSLPD